MKINIGINSPGSLLWESLQLTKMELALSRCSITCFKKENRGPQRKAFWKESGVIEKQIEKLGDALSVGKVTIKQSRAMRKTIRQRITTLRRTLA